MPGQSLISKIAAENRVSLFNKNKYAVSQIDGINNPYDLNDDIVSKSLNLLQQTTGVDYRSNPIVTLVERFIDAKNSELVVEGGKRLLVEFGRRAAINVIGKFIPRPTGGLGTGFLGLGIGFVEVRKI